MYQCTLSLCIHIHPANPGDHYFVKLRTCLMCLALGAYQYQQSESKFVNLSRFSRRL